jgi:integrase
MLCLTALRLNEAVDASWNEFNMRDKIWIVPAGRMKGKDSGKKQARAHSVPLIPEIIDLLESLPRFKNGKQEGKYLFSTTAGRSPTWIGTKIKDRLNRRMLRTLRALARTRGENPADVTLPHFVNHDIGAPFAATYLDLRSPRRPEKQSWRMPALASKAHTICMIIWTRKEKP